MDRLRDFGDEERAEEVAVDTGVETPPSIGTDERRMHVRAYNHWVSMLGDRKFPSIDELEPEDIEDFGPHSVLLDFTNGADDPAIAFLGTLLREECGLDEEIRTISAVPSRSLLSRLTDHYLQIIANEAPIGFEAEFVNTRGNNTLYRGILMPYSSDDETIDFVFGVINWKEVADASVQAGLNQEIDQAMRVARTAQPLSGWADGPSSDPMRASERPMAPREVPDDGFGLVAPRAQAIDLVSDALDYDLADDAGLADRLALARQSAEAVKAADGRSRSALYRALARAYDFAAVAAAHPNDYADLLDDAGIKVQQRSPMTPVAKLVFGADYDKSRLTEFAAALSCGQAEGVTPEAFEDWLQAYPGGLKGAVKAERARRTPAAPPSSRTEAAKNRLRAAQPRAIIEMEAGTEEFVLILARRVSDHGLAILSPVACDQAMVDRAIRISARHTH